jgi:periplasmic copper chaperone A
MTARGSRAAPGSVRLRTLVLPLAACLACSGALAQSPQLSAQDAWIRATPGADVAAAYVTLHNRGTRTVVVIGVRTPAAASAMIHESALVKGQSTMRPRARVGVPPGETVKFEPGGLHIMLQHLTRTLASDDEIPLVLLLEGGGTLNVTAHVRPLTAE